MFVFLICLFISYFTRRSHDIPIISSATFRLPEIASDLTGRRRCRKFLCNNLTTFLYCLFIASSCGTWRHLVASYWRVAPNVLRPCLKVVYLFMSTLKVRYKKPVIMERGKRSIVDLQFGNMTDLKTVLPQTVHVGELQGLNTKSKGEPQTSSIKLMMIDV